MAKFGVFNMGLGETPLQEFEGDYMQQDKQFVGIFKKDPNRVAGDIQVAAIQLDKGQSVKRISD